MQRHQTRNSGQMRKNVKVRTGDKQVGQKGKKKDKVKETSGKGNIKKKTNGFWNFTILNF